MKRNSTSHSLLIPVQPSRQRFHARRGVALLRAWRLRFSQTEQVRPTQIEFNFRSASSMAFGAR